MYGPHYLESWVEHGHGWDGIDVDIYMNTPDHKSNPMDHLTPEQRVEIRPIDSVTLLWTVDDRRNPHLELNKPPWKRTPRSAPSSADAIDWKESADFCVSTGGSD
jgi:hypothetical protein